MLDEQIIKDTDEYYSKKAAGNASGPQASDWNSISAQEIRFEQLCKLLPKEKKEHFGVLDYGCGMGDLQPYIEKLGYTNIDYYGMDASAEIIEKATNKKRESFSRRVFIHGYEITCSYDYIIASGVFNVRQSTSNDRWRRYIINTIEMFNSNCSKGFAFNCLTKYSDKEYMKDYLYYADPLYLFEYCKKSFSRDVALLHDYGIYDFTIIVRKDL